MSWVTPTASGVVCSVRVTPRAGRTAIAGVRDDMLLAKLAAPPVDGAANAALIELIAGFFDVPKRSVDILSGQTGRLKRVSVAGLTVDAALARLATHLE